MSIETTIASDATGPDAELVALHAECMRLEQEHEAACALADNEDDYHTIPYTVNPQ